MKIIRKTMAKPRVLEHSRGGKRLKLTKNGNWVKSIIISNPNGNDGGIAMDGMMEKISLLIIGFDPYKDVWDHYFDLLNKYWSDRPQTYLATNVLTPNYQNVIAIPAGEDAEWSKKVNVALAEIKTPYVILLLEDFFTTEPVENVALEELLDCIIKNQIKYCKLLNQSKIKGDVFDNKKYLRVIGSSEEYGISLQPAIWEKDFLLTMVGTENYNAWIFELNQVKHKKQNSNGIDCIADKRNILKITHAVVQSKYLRKAVRVFAKQNYPLNIEKRPMMSFKENFKYRLKCAVAEIMPKKLRPFFKKIGKLIRIDYVSDRQLKEKSK